MLMRLNRFFCVSSACVVGGVGLRTDRVCPLCFWLGLACNVCASPVLYIKSNTFFDWRDKTVMQQQSSLSSF